MRLIVGLGNPGERYARTRHNIGFRVVERAAVRWSVPLKPAGSASRGTGRLGQEAVTLAKTLAWMNESGPAVKALCEDLGLASEDVVVVHDDLDLPLGRLRIKRNGGAGGHNGILSIIAALETDAFPRLKLGIGRPVPDVDPADYVLSPFHPEESALVDQVLDQAVLALECLIVDGVEVAMNRFNVRETQEGDG